MEGKEYKLSALYDGKEFVVNISEDEFKVLNEECEYEEEEEEEFFAFILNQENLAADILRNRSELSSLDFDDINIDFLIPREGVDIAVELTLVF